MSAETPGVTTAPPSNRWMSRPAPRPGATFKSEASSTGPRLEPGLWGRSIWEMPWRFASLVALAAFFVLMNGAALDVNPAEGRLGLAAREAFGPLGQAFGGWEPTIWPARLLPSQVWAWGEGGTPTSNTVRWPAAIAAALAGLILARRVASRLGGRAGLLCGFAWYGSIALMDRSAGAGLDLLLGLSTVAAFDRLIGRGSDLAAGAWLALAFLTGGWPPVAVVLLATVVIGRQGAALSWRLVLPPAVVAAAWSAWALEVMPAEAWGAALTLPLTQKPQWGLIPGVLALALPWSPLVPLALSRTIRSGWTDDARRFLTGWGQVTLVCLLAGTVVPGLATAATVPALAGLSVAAAAACDGLLCDTDQRGTKARRWFFAATLVLVLGWTGVVVLAGGFLAAAVPYYRMLSVGLIVLAVPLSVLAVTASWKRNAALGMVALCLLAVCVRLGHWGYYVPEWNYRCSQGPWGRAIGQWVPPRYPIYTVHTWPADLAFAIGHPIYQVRSERHLEYQPGDVKFVLLLASEFENWPQWAPKLVKVAAMRDEYDQARVLARTPGLLPWVVSARARLGQGPGSADFK